jgi:preprotein translocase SecF subunit
LSRHLGWRLVAVLLLVGAAGWMAVTKPARLGLDLRGGTQIVLEAKDSPDRRVDGDTLARTLEVLRRRVDQLGVAEPTLQRSGDRRVIVELPGVYDPREATEVIGRTAQLAFHPVLGLAEPDAERSAGGDGLVLADEGGGFLRLGPAAVGGEAVGDARAELDPQFQARWQVGIEFQGDGGRRWAQLTGEAACQPAGDPRRRVAIALDRQVISSPQVDPSVACDQGITGGQTVITGDFSDREAQDLALLIRAGAGLRRALDRGFAKALGAIADSNVTTLLAAGLLFFLASGAVRGFGVTLSVGVLVSLFTALVVTRVLVELVARAGAVRRRPGLLGLEGGGRLAAWLATRGPDLLGRARWWLAGSLVALVLAGAGLVVRGPDFGVEFTGGRLLEYQTARPVDLDAARQVLADAGFPRAVVQASGDGNLTVRTGQLDPAGEEQVQRAITHIGGQVEELRDEFIGPTIGAELRRKALIALGIALVVQLAYLAIRFRWTFGAAAVLAMFHDVAILLGLFAWLGKPLDGVFLAALLTVIGYSVNDSVVVFDRIRERLRSRTREPLAKLANDACLQTIPRTVNTGLGALFILAALFVLGGDTLTDFALALLVGILVGTYSSVFVATPLLVAFEGASGRPPTTTTRPAARQPTTTTVPTGARARAATGGRRASNAQSTSSAPRSGQRKRPAQRSRGRRR